MISKTAGEVCCCEVNLLAFVDHQFIGTDRAAIELGNKLQAAGDRAVEDDDKCLVSGAVNRRYPVTRTSPYARISELVTIDGTAGSP